MDNPFKPNDVAVVMRPVMKDDGEWSGEFELMVCVVGPVTLDEEHMQDLVGVGTLMATTVSIMEEDTTFTARILKKCDEIYQEGKFDLGNERVVDKDHVLTSYTKTVGGMQ